MSESHPVISYETALSMLPDGEMIHTMIGSGMVFGADWPREKVIAGLESAKDNIRLTGDRLHGLAFCDEKNRVVRVETREE